MTPDGSVPGSFRDPAGRVFRSGQRIFRGIRQPAAAQVLDFLASDFYRRHTKDAIVDTRVIEPAEVINAGLPAGTAQSFALWVEHQPIEFISYPYEWSFEQLRTAAVFHLDLHLEALAAGYDLQDATAYNVQFRGCQPVFIDLLSFRAYQEGSHWLGYKQFCEQFLAPLALNAYARVDFNPWFRGALEGVDLPSAARLLPASSFLSLSLLANVHAQAWAMSRMTSRRRASGGRAYAGLPRRNYIHLLASLRRFIAGLRSHDDTFWAGYRPDSSYSKAGAQDKESVVSAFVQRERVERLLDIGCNTGYYSEKAIAAGARHVVGADFDTGALNVAFRSAAAKKLNITPILLDICNPSPALGWRLAERQSLFERLRGLDATISLAVIHHVLIGRNVPMEEYVDWLVDLAPRGLAEFVPKSDPMVAGLLAHRQDIFPDYTREAFLRLLSRRARITAVHPISNSERVLVAFCRR